MTKQSATYPLWLKIILWIAVPLALFFGGVAYAIGNLVAAGAVVFCALLDLIFLTRAVNQTLWVTVGMRFSVAVSLFIAGTYSEMDDLPFAIGFGVGGLLVYACCFRPSVERGGVIGRAEDAAEAKDNSTTEESDSPD